MPCKLLRQLTAGPRILALLSAFTPMMMHDVAGDNAGDDEEQGHEHDALSLSSSEQSSATRNHGVRRRSGFGIKRSIQCSIAVKRGGRERHATPTAAVRRRSCQPRLGRAIPVQSAREIFKKILNNADFIDSFLARPGEIRTPDPQIRSLVLCTSRRLPRRSARENRIGGGRAPIVAGHSIHLIERKGH